MVGLTLKLESADIVFDGNGRLKTTDDIAQSYKVLIETQYESDYRDPTYGFKLQELMQVGIQDQTKLVELYVREVLLQHHFTKQILEITVIKESGRRFSVITRVELRNEEEVSILSEVAI